ELRLAVETAPDVEQGRRLFVGAERAVSVAAELFRRQALSARNERRTQDFVFHRFTAAFNFRLALTMYALAPLVLVRPSAVVTASSRMSWPKCSVITRFSVSSRTSSINVLTMVRAWRAERDASAACG